MPPIYVAVNTYKAIKTIDFINKKPTGGLETFNTKPCLNSVKIVVKYSSGWTISNIVPSTPNKHSISLLQKTHSYHLPNAILMSALLFSLP